MSKYNSILIELEDNVVTTLQNIKKGKIVTAIGLKKELLAKDDVTKGHKVAIRDIGEGEYVFKYGKHIGVAISDILAGEHVHIHNIKSNRGKELKEGY